MVNTIQQTGNSAPLEDFGNTKGVKQGIFNTLEGKIITDFIGSLNIEHLKSLFEDIFQNSDEKRKKFIEDLGAIVQVYKKLESIVNEDHPLQKYLVHDVRTIGTLSSLLDTLIQIETISIEGYVDMVKKVVKTFIAFLEGLYFVIPMSQDFIESKKIRFSLKKAIYTALDSSEVHTGNIGDVQIYGTETIQDIEMFGVEGDFIIFLMNIIKNAKKHGRASAIRFWIKKEGVSTFLVIDDNGSGIPSNILGTLFEVGKSGGGSTGIGLRDTQSRGIDVKAENQGLLSGADTSSRGARFTILIQK